MDRSFPRDGDLSIKSLLCALDKRSPFVPKEMHRRVGANKLNESQQLLEKAGTGVHLESP